MAGTKTPTQRLADAVLGEPVEDFIARRRASGRTWRAIARDIYEASNGELDPTPQTVINWSSRSEPAA